MPANTYTLIEKIVVGAAGASSITFTSIPQTYTDLMIVFSLRSSTAGEDTQLSFNSSTANFSSRNLAGNGSSASSGSRSDSIISASMNYSTYTASTFSNGSLYIPNYTSSNNKSFSVDTVVENNATTAPMQLIAGLWSNTAAITSITFTNYAAGNYTQYSTAYLYGIAKEGVSPSPSSAPYATGGDRIVFDGTYWYHAFTSSGTFTPRKGLSCDVLVVAGGGGGGMQQAGGGGAGGVFYAASQGLTNTNYTVTVGSGGSRSTVNNAPGSNGSNSVFGSLTAAVGGGGGGSRFDTNGSSPGVGQNGGSGGGGGYTGAGGTGTSGQGNNGATGNTSGGGGGGAGAVGGNLAGGAGTNTYSAFASATSTGVSNYYAGGGGGGEWGATGGVGGSGGGGHGGGSSYGQPTAGTTNTGGGGGGGYYDGSSPTNYYGANGGSGIVIVRYAA